MPLVGEYLKRPTYKILNTIGEGNQGICVLAQHEVFGQLVVQKTVGTLGQPDSLVRVNCEPAILHEIQHDRIIRVHEAQWEPAPEWAAMNAVTFVMPYYEEGSVLDALLAGHRFGVRDTVRITCDILSGLACMHDDHSLIHRDVKPANVLLEDKRSRAVLSDFGSAGHADPITDGVSAEHVTRLYLSPESGRTKLVTRASDLYAVGMLMVEMLNGHLPYHEIDFTDVEIRLERGKRSVSDVQLEPAMWVPKPLASIVRSLCHDDPAKRPLSAADAIRQLQKLRVIDWRHAEGVGLEGTWLGYWPPNSRRADQRTTRVTITRSSRDSSERFLRAKVDWKHKNGKWRAYRDLSREIAGEERLVRRFFREVDVRAQAAPTS